MPQFSRTTQYVAGSSICLSLSDNMIPCYPRRSFWRIHFGEVARLQHFCCQFMESKPWLKFATSNRARMVSRRANPTPRRLAAIVAGDIAGYSRLMQIDEEGTHGRVKRIERDLIEPSIAEHHGRLVKTTGDGFLAIFDSPVEAVRCGIVIQQNMVGRNASLPRHHWIEYRIGVNLGDVIIEADDVYGDGVNIASRLEGIADPGQVYISGGIYEQIKHKLVCGYESLGDRKVKNITDPVRVYRVLPDPAAFNRTRKRRENILIVLLSIVLLASQAALFGICFGNRTARWEIRPRPRFRQRYRRLQPPPTAKQAAPALPPAPQPKRRPALQWRLPPRNKQHRNLSRRLPPQRRRRRSESPR